MTHILHIVGCKNAGKTRLIELLIPRLSVRLDGIGTLKYAERDHFTWEREGTDTGRHFTAGSRSTAIIGDHAFAYETRGDARVMSLTDFVRMHFADVALVLTEGFNAAPGFTIEVQRAGYTDRRIVDDAACLLTYGDSIIAHPAPHFPCGTEDRLSDYIVANLDRLARVS